MSCPPRIIVLEGMFDCREACLILCDLMMPVMSGIAFLDSHQDLGDTVVGIPVFIVSAGPVRARHARRPRRRRSEPVEPLEKSEERAGALFLVTLELGAHRPALANPAPDRVLPLTLEVGSHRHGGFVVHAHAHGVGV